MASIDYIPKPIMRNKSLREELFNEKNYELQSDLQGWHSFKPSLDYRGAKIVSTN